MFGSYRYALACLVVLTHLAGRQGAGGYAVFGFYMLSGLLMTWVLNERYGFSVKGLSAYASNRALRIFPPYWIVLAGALVSVSLAPELASSLHRAIVMPQTAGEWIQNLFIFGIDTSDRSRLIPPTWSLHVELCFYLGMGCLLARDRRIVNGWVLASLAYTAFLVATEPNWRLRYFPVGPASLPFSLGAWIYFQRERLRGVDYRWAWLLGPLFVGNALFAREIWPDFRTWGFYTSLALAFGLQIALLNARVQAWPDWLRRIDQRLGDLSYPMFLCHHHVGIAVAWVFSRDAHVWSREWFLVSFVALNLVALAIHAAVEAPVNLLRNRIREGAEKAPVPVSVDSSQRVRSR